MEDHGYSDEMSPGRTFTAKLTRQGEHSMVSLSGEIDLAKSNELRQILRQVPSGESVVVECAGVTFMDTVGFRVLLYENHRHSSHGGGLRIREPSQFMRRLLVITGMTYLIETP